MPNPPLIDLSMEDEIVAEADTYNELSEWDQDMVASPSRRNGGGDDNAPAAELGPLLGDIHLLMDADDAPGAGAAGGQQEQRNEDTSDEESDIDEERLHQLNLYRATVGAGKANEDHVDPRDGAVAGPSHADAAVGPSAQDAVKAMVLDDPNQGAAAAQQMVVDDGSRIELVSS